MAERIAALESGKVDVTPIVPGAAKPIRIAGDELS
jgi:hypothetical protein